MTLFFFLFLKNVNWFYLLADLFPDFLICFAFSFFFSFFLYVGSGEICAFTYCIYTVFKFLVAAGSLDKEEQSKPLVC